MDPAASTLAPGASLGRYRIIAPLARGGMAELYLARAEGVAGFEKLVAVKRLLPELAARDDFARMFLDEARIAATLDHPHIVHTVDVGVAGGEYFLAMEYLVGEDAESIRNALRMRDQRFPIEHALQIAIAVCAGLHHAHEKLGPDGQPLAIVHRDVTPHNVFVTWEGAVKLLDFGVARAAGRYQETNAGTIKGKVSYLSPEQCRSDDLDRRSDLFSLGIVLWELTLSRRLFAGLNALEVVDRIVSGRVPPPRSLDPDYPPALEAVVMRALEKKPSRRHDTARALQEDLEGVARELGFFLAPSRLSQFMESLFARKIELWRDGERRGLPTERIIEATRQLSIDELVEMPLPVEPTAAAPAAPREPTRELTMSELVEMPAPGEAGRRDRVATDEVLRRRKGSEADDEPAWAVPLGVVLGHLLALLIIVAVAYLRR